MAYPLPRIHKLQRSIESAQLEIEIPAYFDISALRVVAPRFVLQGTCSVEKYDSMHGAVSSGNMETEIFNSLVSFPIGKSLASSDRIFMKFNFQLPNVFPDGETVKLYVIAG